jgi:L-asparaginase
MKKIAIFYTGGTIGMIENDGILVPSATGPLNNWLTSYASRNDISIEFIGGYEPIDSSNANPNLWSKLALGITELDEKYNGILILHGTDTMAYTASALSFLLPSIEIPIIVTGSQYPLSQEGSDAELNLTRSIQLLTTLPEGELPKEVFIFFDNYLFRGNRSTKIDNEGIHAFESPNYPHCLKFDEHGNIEFNPNFRPIEKHDFLFPCTALKPVHIKVVMLFPGIEDLDIDLDTCQAIILMTFGAGNAPTNPSFLKKLQEFTDHGIIVLGLSQCLHKSNQTSTYQTGVSLRHRGVIDMGDLTLEACFAKLYYTLSIGYLHPKKYLTRNLVGEITPIIATYSSQIATPDYSHFTPVKICLVLQNSRYFSLGLLGDILRNNNLTVCLLFVPDNYRTLKKINSRQIDLVIMLGSNSSVNYADQMPWISAEIEFAKVRIEQGLPLIGVCFGGQVMAVAAGARVQKGTRGKEIGLHSLLLTEAGHSWPTMSLISKVFEFHGETFDLPTGATLLATTEKYPQAFLIGNCCLAMQFHLEIAEHEFNALFSEFLDYIIDGGVDIKKLKQEMQHEFRNLKQQAKMFFESIFRQFLSNCFQTNQSLSSSETRGTQPTIQPTNSAQIKAGKPHTDIRKNVSFDILPTPPRRSSGNLPHSQSLCSFFTPRSYNTPTSNVQHCLISPETPAPTSSPL